MMKKILFILITFIIVVPVVYANSDFLSAANKILNENTIENNLTLLELKYEVHYYFNVYRIDEMTKKFYIDAKNKKVYDENKQPVDYIKDFSNENISFMIINYTKDFKTCHCYDINRYSGNVEYYMFRHPLTFKGKMENNTLKLKDGAAAFGKGIATKIDISKQRF